MGSSCYMHGGYEDEGLRSSAFVVGGMKSVGQLYKTCDTLPQSRSFMLTESLGMTIDTDCGKRTLLCTRTLRLQGRSCHTRFQAERMSI